MQVYGPAHLHGVHPVNAPHAARPSRTARPDVSTPIQDDLQLSDAARALDKVRHVPEIRQERVARIRAEIAAGTYETEQKLEIAIGRLLDEIG